MPLRVSTTTGEIKGIFFVMEIKEIWKDVPGYEGYYQASDLGRIRSLDRVVKWNNFTKKVKGRCLRYSLKNNGYYGVTLCDLNNKKRYVLVHRLVIITFIGYSKLQVDHINEIKTDNRLVNLRYLDNRTNTARSFKNTTSKYVGVCWDKSNWRAQITINGLCRYIGSFKNEYDAHLAYQEALHNWNHFKKLPN